MALALYRKYRPATFAEVVGQEHVTEPLSRAIEAGRINHAYLFSGPRGCGKTSSARILARSLNCELGPTPEPCGVCSSCVSLAPGGPGNIDVTELDAASHGGVDDTRELRDRAFFAPAESRYRVFIVDEAHMISTQGFNALLKIVEEPPEHLVFVFATTEPEKVLTTIRSRTHHYPFRLIPPGMLRSLLERVCAEEGVTVAPAVYPLVIRAGGGSARDSLSVLDQLVSGAGPDGVTYERAVALLGVSDLALIDGVVDGLAAGDRAAVFETVDRLVEAGHDPRRFASDLLQRLRDLTLVHAVPDAAQRGLVDAAGDEVARMAGQAARLGPATLTRYGEIVHAGLVEMRGATAPRLLLELLCARMLLPAAVPTEAGLLERLERLERLNAIAPVAADSAAGADEREGPASRSYARTSTRVAGPATVSDDRSAAVPDAAPTGVDPSHPSAGADQPNAGAEVPARADARAGEPPTGHPAPTEAPAPTGAPARTGDPAPTLPAAIAGPAGDATPAGSGPSSAPEPGAGSGAAPIDPAPGEHPPAPPLLDAAAVRQIWPEILTQAKERKKRTAALLVSATVRSVEGDTLVLSIGTAPLARMLSEQSNLDVIADALHAVLGVRWRVRCTHGDPQGDLAAPSARSSSARTSGAVVSGKGAPSAGASPPGPAARENAAPPATATARGSASPRTAAPRHDVDPSGVEDPAGAASPGIEAHRSGTSPDRATSPSDASSADTAGARGSAARPEAGAGGPSAGPGSSARAPVGSARGATPSAHEAIGPRDEPPRREAPTAPTSAPGTERGGGMPAPDGRTPPRRGKSLPRRRSSASEEGVPLPPEPADEDVAPPEEEEEMLAEAAVAPADRVPVAAVAEDNGPERAALALLTTQLGARAIDPR